MGDDAVEKEESALEIQKWKESLAIEKEKLRLEKRSMWVSTGSIVIPLLVVALTIYENTQAQKAQSRDDFDLKAAQVVLEAKTVSESQNRADGLVALLPERFPTDLSERLQPLHDKFQQRLEMDKRALLNLLVAAPKERRKEILDLWLTFYPKDKERLPEGLVALVEHR